MTLIEGIGDEVTHFFIVLLIILIVTIAWWTTSITDQGGAIRTVFLLERRRIIGRRRLTNHTESVDIVEGESLYRDFRLVSLLHVPNITSGEDQLSNTEVVTNQPEGTNPEMEAEAGSSDFGSSEEPRQEVEDEQHRIVEVMDANNSTAEIRQRRLAFYNKSTGEKVDGTNTSNEDTTTSTNKPRETDAPLSAHMPEPIDHDDGSIRVKLKYLNDDLRLVDGKLLEQLGDFKKRHFQVELSTNKLVRLIFNGHVLQRDTDTLQGCGFFDNCVVHCLVHQRRTTVQEESHSEDGRRDNFMSSNRNMHLNNNDDQGQEWRLENYLFVILCIFLGAAWYLRYVYSHLYTITATIGLILMTGIFSIIVVGMHFPDNDPLNEAQRTEIAQPQQ